MVCTRTERVRSQALAVLFYRLCCEACRGTSHSAHTHPLSSASSLKPAHTATLYCHSQMILLHFQLKGNVHGVSAYFWSYALRACSCDSLTVIHVWGRMRGFPPRVHVCFVPPIRLRWCEQRKVSSRLSTITQMAPEQCQLKKKEEEKKTSIFSCVLASVGVCLHAEDLFDSSDSPGLTWNTFRVKHSFHIPRLFLFIYFTGIWKSGKWSSFVWF